MMRVLIDRLTAAAKPELCDPAFAPSAEWEVEVFYAFRQPTEVLDEFAAYKPDLLIVNPIWLEFSVVLKSLLETAGDTATKPVVASAHVDCMLKIRSVHHGFFDLVDLAMPIEELFSQLAETCQGVSKLADDRIWQTIHRPSVEPDAVHAPADDLDRSILQLVSLGFPDRDIAAVIHMALQSVRNRISAMLERSGTHNRTELARTYRNQVFATEMVNYLQVAGSP